MLLLYVEMSMWLQRLHLCCESSMQTQHSFVACVVELTCGEKILPPLDARAAREGETH